MQAYVKEETKELLFMPYGLLFEDLLQQKAKKVLNLAYWRVKDNDMTAIARVNGPQCVELNLTQCMDLTDKGLKELACFR